MSHSPPKPHPKPRPSPQRDQVVRTCLNALRSLPTKRDKEIALGQIIAGLMHSTDLTSPMQVFDEVSHTINHYNAPIEPRPY